MHKYDDITPSPSIKVHASVYMMPIISTSGSENISMARAAHTAPAWLFIANAALLAVLISVGRYWMSTWLELQRLQTGRASTRCVITWLFVSPQIHAWACGKSKSLTISHCQVSRYLHHDKDPTWAHTFLLGTEGPLRCWKEYSRPSQWRLGPLGTFNPSH